MMIRKVLKLVQVSSPPPSLSPLHVPGSYGLPSSSRLPKFMIAAVAGFILLTTLTYYFFKWFCFRKYWTSHTVADTESSSAGGGGTADASQDEVRDRTNKALAQRLGGKIAMGIPTITYAQLAEIRAVANKSKEDVESEACAVCLNEFSKNQTSSAIKLLPKCTHAFHSTCIDLWLSTQASCPVCRASLFTLFSVSCPSPENVPQGDGDTNV